MTKSSCPMCSVYIEKNGGCRHMTCRNCGFEYCWDCHQKYVGHDFEICEIKKCVLLLLYILIVGAILIKSNLLHTMIIFF